MLGWGVQSIVYEHANARFGVSSGGIKTGFASDLPEDEGVVGKTLAEVGECWGFAVERWVVEARNEAVALNSLASVVAREVVDLVQFELVKMFGIQP